jgi:hypothetical protein
MKEVHIGTQECELSDVESVMGMDIRKSLKFDYLKNIAVAE